MGFCMPCSNDDGDMMPLIVGGSALVGVFVICLVSSMLARKKVSKVMKDSQTIAAHAKEAMLGDADAAAAAEQVWAFQDATKDQEDEKEIMGDVALPKHAKALKSRKKNRAPLAKRVGPGSMIGAVQRWASRHSTSIKIIITLVQLLSNLGSVYDVQYPALYSDMLRWMDLINMNFLSGRLPCTDLPSGFHATLVIRTALPAFVILGLGLTSACLRKKHKNASGACASLAFVIVFVVYPGCTNITLRTFLCKTLDNGEKWLRADYSINCNSSAHVFMSFYAAAMGVLYIVGTPLLYAFLLCRHRQALFALRRQQDRGHARHVMHKALRHSPRVASHTADWQIFGGDTTSREYRDETHAHAVEELPTYMTKIIGNYQMHAWWFEVFECIR